MNYKRIYKIIDKFDYVSFDVFDTLLVRFSYNPKNVFEILEKRHNKKFNKKNVYLDRIKAEENARKKTQKKEITLEDIYSSLIDYDEKEKKWLMEEEEKIEDSLLIPNKEIKPIYNYCIEKNKKIIIESDMYLSKKFIMNSLKKNGFIFDEIYVSSDTQTTKRDGSMYKYMLESNNISSNRIIHFGDSIKSDYIMAKKNGIYSILIKKYIKKNKKNTNVNDFEHLVNKKFEKPTNKYSKLGYEKLGLFYLSYSQWIYTKLEENSINKVFFLSRDGYIMKKGFDILYEEIQSNYLYVSRRSLIIPALYFETAFDKMLELTNIEVLENLSIDYFMKKIGLNPEEYMKIINKFGYRIDSRLTKDDFISQSKLRMLYKEIEPQIKKNAKRELDELLSYLAKEKFYGRVAIVDIGWQGTMQKALNIILKNAKIDIDIYGFYIGLKKTALNFKNGHMYGYCFDPLNNKLENDFFSFGGLFEYFYSNKDGSVINYYNNKPRLALNEYNNTDFADYMEKIQNGGLEYLKRVYKIYNLYNFNNIETKEIAIKKLLKFGRKPKMNELKLFDKLYYSNIDNVFLLPQHSLIYYIFHLKQLKIDLNGSFWKVGFLKKLFILPFPYFLIYDFFKRK